MGAQNRLAPVERPLSAGSGVSVWHTSSVGSNVSSTVETLKAAVRIDYFEVTLQVLIVIIPLSVIGALVVLTYSQADDAMQQSLQLESALNDGYAISGILNAVEAEKMATCSYLTEKSLGHAISKLRKSVSAARVTTDQAVQKAELVWERNGFGEIMAFVQSLNDVRLKADETDMDCLALFTVYEPVLNLVITNTITLFGLNVEGRTCQMLGAFQAWILAQEHLGRRIALGSSFFNGETFDNVQHEAYFLQKGATEGLLSYSVHATEAGQINTEVDMDDAWMTGFIDKHPDKYEQYRQLEDILVSLNYTAAAEIDEEVYHDTIDPFLEHVQELEENIQNSLLDYLTKKAADEATQFYIVLVSTIIVCIVCPALAFVYGYYARKQRFKLVNAARRMKEQSKLLAVEEQKTVQLLNQLLPPIVTDRIRSGEIVEPEMYESVTVLVADIVGFTPLCSKSTPLQVVAMLNSLFLNIDRILELHDCYKVETIGDAVVVASGVPVRNGSRHSAEIATVALGLLMAVKNVEIAHSPGEHPLIRVGIHTGAATAGVVGNKSPKYCLLGQTPEFAALMESHSKGMHVQLSEQACTHLTNFHTEFTVVERGEIEVKGKGRHTTFWLKSKSNHPHVVDFAEAERLVEVFQYNKKTGIERLASGMDAEAMSIKEI